MYRFLLLYVSYGESGSRQCFAEGLVHFDRSVYVRDFWIEEGKYFGDMHRLRCWLRDNNDLLFWRIQMIDEIPKGEPQ